MRTLKLLDQRISVFLSTLPLSQTDFMLANFSIMLILAFCGPGPMTLAFPTSHEFLVFLCLLFLVPVYFFLRMALDRLFLRGAVSLCLAASCLFQLLTRIR